MTFDFERHARPRKPDARVYVTESVEDGVPTRTIHPLPGRLVCDFCSDPAVTTSFTCAPFVLDQLGPETQASADDWAACAACTKHILKRDRAALTNRSVQNLARTNKTQWKQLSQADRGRVRRDLARAHDGFFEHWTGEHHPHPGPALDDTQHD